MKIIHFTPFAPNACGLYEAARDMAVADARAGHEVHLVDLGTTVDGGNHQPGKPGKLDSRGDNIVTADPKQALSTDMIIAHSGIPDNLIVGCQAPIIWILHGRPAACFLPELAGRGNSYSLIKILASWPRVKAMVTFWEYHVKFWELLIPNEKLVCFDAPPIDEKRFGPNGPKHDFKGKGGKWNIVIADTCREDVSTFEVAYGVLEFVKAYTEGGVKVHFYGMNKELGPWQPILQEMDRLECLGDVWIRKPDMEEVYRAADILLSPQRIVTRVVGESLSCGTPVIAALGCEYATWNTCVENPGGVVGTLRVAVSQLENKEDIVKKEVCRAAEAFSLSKYNNAISEVYRKVLRTN